MKYVLSVCLYGISLLQAQDLTKYVNPFIGTGGHGHTWPGATVPFGAVQLSPDTRNDGYNDWDGCGGYHYSDSIIYGFSHTHLSGTGVADYCDILLLPGTGKVKLNSKQNGDVVAEKRAPHSRGEMAAMAAFAVLGAVGTYVLFGRIYFRRLLFNNRQEVGSALGWSNLAVILSWTGLFVGVSVLFFYPYVIWAKPTTIYGLVICGYTAIVLVVFGLTTMMTRR